MNFNSTSEQLPHDGLILMPELFPRAMGRSFDVELLKGEI